MRLVLDENRAVNTIRAHAPGEVWVGEQRLTEPFIVSPLHLISDWPVRRLAELDETALAPVFALKPRILLIGVDAATAPTVPRALRRWCESRDIALDVMGLGAACRTYEVLASERREVAAALLLKN